MMRQRVRSASAWANVTGADMTGALTDQPAGRALSELPYDDMIRDHARWCETGGGEGGRGQGEEDVRTW